jgi:hypothetical protein
MFIFPVDIRHLISLFGTTDIWLECFCRLYPFQTKGIVALCSCDPTNADMSSLGFVLLHLTGAENLTAKTESQIHIYNRRS